MIDDFRIFSFKSRRFLIIYSLLRLIILRRMVGKYFTTAWLRRWISISVTHHCDAGKSGKSVNVHAVKKHVSVFWKKIQHHIDSEANVKYHQTKLRKTRNLNCWWILLKSICLNFGINFISILWDVPWSKTSWLVLFSKPSTEEFFT